MFWTFGLAFAIFASVITCEYATLANAKWKYDIDTANSSKTEFVNADFFGIEKQNITLVSTNSTTQSKTTNELLFPSLLKWFPSRSNKKTPPKKSPPRSPPRKTPTRSPPRYVPTRSPPRYVPTRRATRRPAWRPQRPRWRYPTRRWRPSSPPSHSYPPRYPHVTGPKPPKDAGPNLTTITWQHDCNTRISLNKALNSGVEAIVADVILGYRGKNQTKQPIMRQTGDQSDFSLEEFIAQTIQYHKIGNHVKIVKLNFGSFDAVPPSITILLAKQKEIKFPIWLHADTVKGPGNGNSTLIDGDKFITEVKKMNSNVVLSVGWTADVRPSYSEEGYSIPQIESMAQVVDKTLLVASDSKPMAINFPIHAVYALQCQDLLKELYNGARRSNPVTFTVEAAKGDDVDAVELTKFIKSYGVGNVYLDLPEELRDKLNLGNSASSLVQVCILNLIAFAIATVFSQ